MSAVNELCVCNVSNIIQHNSCTQFLLGVPSENVVAIVVGRSGLCSDGSKILEPNISALKFQTLFCSRIEIFEHFNLGCSG